CGSLLKPPGFPSCCTATLAPWLRASLRPALASPWLRSDSESAKSLADSMRPAITVEMRSMGQSSEMMTSSLARSIRQRLPRRILAPVLRCNAAPALEGAGKGRLVGVAEVQRKVGDRLSGQAQLLARLGIANLIEQPAKGLPLLLQRHLQTARMLA